MLYFGVAKKRVAEHGGELDESSFSTWGDRSNASASPGAAGSEPMSASSLASQENEFDEVAYCGWDTSSDTATDAARTGVERATVTGRPLPDGFWLGS